MLKIAKIAKDSRIKILIGILVVGVLVVGILVIEGWWIWKNQIISIQTPETNIRCMPSRCCTLYCENEVNLSNWYECKVFAKVCAPPSPECPGGTIYYIQGKIVSKEEFLQKIREKNEMCNNCLTSVPVPCR